MKLIYIANIRLPTEKAHGIQIMKMCEAFGLSGIEAELIVPWRFNKIKEDPFRYYGVEKNFKIIKLPSFDLVKFGKVGFIIQSLSFAKCAFWYALFKKADIIYSRDKLPLFFLSFFKKNLFWEWAHRGEFNFIVQRLLKKCRGIIAITRGLKDFYLKNGANGEKILVAPDGVDMDEFNIDISKEKARQKLNLPKDKKIILYSGSLYLYDWKGVDVLLGAIKYLPDDYLVVLVGGEKEESEKIKKACTSDKLLLVGRKAHREIPFYLKAADVLVLPNKKGDETSEKYTSPLKLFEYMASKRPIVASDLSSIREILSEENAVLVEPNNPEALAEGIKKILQNPELSDKISKQSFHDVRDYTWGKRAERVLDFIKR